MLEERTDLSYKEDLRVREREGKNMRRIYDGS